MLDRQGDAVHADGDDGVPTIEGVLGWEPVVPAVKRPADDLGRAVLDAGRFEEPLERHTEPAGVADETATDLVGDAGHGDVGLDHRPAEQIVVRQLELVVDHAVDAQRPVLGLDLGHHESSVDPVEGDVGRDERREAVDGEVDVVGQRREGLVRPGQRDPGPGCSCADALGEEPAH